MLLGQLLGIQSAGHYFDDIILILGPTGGILNHYMRKKTLDRPGDLCMNTTQGWA